MSELASTTWRVRTSAPKLVYGHDGWPLVPRGAVRENRAGNDRATRGCELSGRHYQVRGRRARLVLGGPHVATVSRFDERAAIAPRSQSMFESIASTIANAVRGVVRVIGTRIQASPWLPAVAILGMFLLVSP